MSNYPDPEGLSRFEFKLGRVFRTHVPPESTFTPNYGNRTAAQELIDMNLLNHDCVKWWFRDWHWRCGLARLGEFLVGLSKHIVLIDDFRVCLLLERPEACDMPFFVV
jgi:hypothetical protein